MYPLGWDPGAEHGCRDCMLLGWQLGGVSGRAAASPGSPAWLLALHIGCRRLLPRASECPVRGAGGAEALLFMMQDAQPPALLVSGGCRWLLQADLQPQAWVSNNGSGVCGGSGVVSRVHLYLLRAKLPGKGGRSFHSDMTKERRWVRDKGTKRHRLILTSQQAPVRTSRMDE